jgi:Cellulase (glycosyl hydrolase family 5)
VEASGRNIRGDWRVRLRQGGSRGWPWRAAIATLLLVLISASFSWRAEASPPSAISGLHVVGNEIRNDANLPLRLRGANEPSSEYACIYNYGIFQHRVAGVTDDTSVQALQSWKINVLRLPLNEDCWLNVNTAGIDSKYVGADYQTAIDQYVTKLTNAGIAVILDLHWTAPGSEQATSPQLPMPDRDHSITFWQQVANAFKNNTGVIFDLFNEPFPADNADSDAAWSCLRDGSPAGGPTPSCPGPVRDEHHNIIRASNYAAAGMQELLNVVRSGGATNLVMVPGVAFTGVLSQWMTYKPNDPLNNLAASVHIYPGSSQCSDLSCINKELGPLVQSYPLIAGELGQGSCAVDLINPVIDWLESTSQHFLAWQWTTVSCDGSDGQYYGLITDYGTGAPTAGYGEGYKDDLARLVQSEPRFTSSAHAVPVPPATASPDGSVGITAHVTSSTAITVVVVLYIYTPDGNFLDQVYFQDQAFTANEDKPYNWNWTVPQDAVGGTYSVRIGAFDSAFTDRLYWNDAAAQFIVNA